MNQQIEDQQGLRQLILDMGKVLKAVNDRIGALESDVATIARREIKSGEQIVTPTGETIIDCMVQMKNQMFWQPKPNFSRPSTTFSNHP